MPSIDPTTGRQNGAANRRRAAANAAARAKLAQLAPEIAATLPEMRGIGGEGTEPETDPIQIGPPPLSSVADGVAWAASLQVLAAQHAEQGRDPARVRAVGCVVKAIGAVKATAADSERAVTVAAAYLGLTVRCTEDVPPGEPAGYVLWAFHRLCHLAYSCATQPDEVQDTEVAHRAKALALVAQVQPQAAINELAAQAEEAAAAAQVPLRAV